jgi:hypothetical protein
VAEAWRHFEYRKGNVSRWKPLSEDNGEETAECKDLVRPIENYRLCRSVKCYCYL